VAEICRRYKFSRETYYRYRRRYLAARTEATAGTRRSHRIALQIDDRRADRWPRGSRS
jgi:hypothetical protein